MELTLKNKAGDTATVELPWEQMKGDLLKELGPSGSEAHLAEDAAKVAQLQEEVGQAQAEVARLEEEVGKLHDYFTNMTPEAYLELGRQLGYEVEMAEATEAEVAEAGTGEGAQVEDPAPTATADPPKPEVVHADPHDEASYVHLPLQGIWALKG